MEKIVTIDGKQVHLKSSAGTMVKYKSQFNREWLDDVGKIAQLFKNYKQEGLNEIEVLKVVPMLYDMTWALAKTANNNIDVPDVWYEQFEMYGILNSIEQIMDLIISNFGNAEKKAIVPQGIQEQ